MGVVAAVAIPAFVNYVRRSKTIEARANVNAIARGVATAGTETGTLPPALPTTPASAPGPERQTWPADAAPGWDAIGFHPYEGLYYVYEYAPGADGRSFVVRARGDLDGDGVESTFEVTGELAADGTVTVSRELIVTNELE